MTADASDLLTTSGVAFELGITTRRVQKMIEDGRLPATKLGHDYFINRRDLVLVLNRKAGRPRRIAEGAVGYDPPASEESGALDEARSTPG